MRLPSSVLGTLRVGLGASALLAAGCDAADPAPAAARAVEAADAVGPTDASAAARPQAVADAESSLGEEIEQLVEHAAEDPLSHVSPIVAVASVLEDPTDFVPFSEDPSAVRPIEPRPRVRTPATPPNPAPVSGHWATPEPVEPEPAWSGDPCPPCGRG